jgi:dTDP-D-glucose 4,6-dehydratase
MTLLVTGGAGFIGSNFALDWFAAPNGSAKPIVTLE